MFKTIAFALAAALLAAGMAGPAKAALIFFDNRAAFEAASGLSGIDEDFEEANVGPGAAVVTSSPLDATTNDGIFSPGDIAAGLSLSGSTPGNQLAALGDGFAGPSKKIAAFDFDDLNIISLNPAVTAIGFDLFVTSASGTLDIELLDALGGALGATSVTGVNDTTPTFFGVISDMGAIGQLIIGGQGEGEAIDNITFGNAVAQLPEPGTLALLGLGLAGLGVMGRRRHRGDIGYAEARSV